jgi:hypothetical protein
MQQPAKIIYGGLSLVLVACTPLLPATTPPQLQHTPGVMVVVAQDTITVGELRVNVPPRWRIVKSSLAAAPLAVVLVAPDEQTTITVSLATPIATPAAANITVTQVLADGAMVTISGQYAPEAETVFQAGWAIVLASFP